MGQVGGDLESNMSVRTLDSLTVSIDTTAVLYVSLGLLAVMLVRRRHIVHTDAAQVATKPVGAPMTGMNVEACHAGKSYVNRYAAESSDC